MFFQVYNNSLMLNDHVRSFEARKYIEDSLFSKPLATPLTGVELAMKNLFETCGNIFFIYYVVFTPFFSDGRKFTVNRSSYAHMANLIKIRLGKGFSNWIGLRVPPVVLEGNWETSASFLYRHFKDIGQEKNIIFPNYLLLLLFCDIRTFFYKSCL